MINVPAEPMSIYTTFIYVNRHVATWNRGNMEAWQSQRDTGRWVKTKGMDGVLGFVYIYKLPFMSFISSAAAQQRLACWEKKVQQLSCLEAASDVFWTIASAATLNVLEEVLEVFSPVQSSERKHLKALTGGTAVVSVSYHCLHTHKVHRPCKSYW